MKKINLQKTMDQLYEKYMIDFSSLCGKVNKRECACTEAPETLRFMLMYAGPLMGVCLLDVLAKLEDEDLCCEDDWNETYKDIMEVLEKAGIYLR